MEIIDEQSAAIQFPVAIVVSRFNEEITGLLLEGALARLRERDFHEGLVRVVWVPGAVEIPLAAQKLAALGTYDAIICLGAVIRGETTHYDYVCDQVSNGVQSVALQFGLPVIFGVLTTENDEQAQARVGGAHGHKGRDAVDAAVEMVAALRRI
ncbi:MAG: 6,7-dimethyl-8-ribityllumazine synthase [Bdellovibrionales bacterium]|nr:6,7-dimethyl-8-ribityllumazine synthase [Bdellovibrionales bacterium]